MVEAGTFCRFIGGSGTNTITAPFPRRESAELPRTFYALTVACTLAPLISPHGGEVRVVIGIVQDLAWRIVSNEPSQLVRSSTR